MLLKFFSIIAVSIFSAGIYAAPKDYPEFYPQKEQLIEREGYTLLYSSEHKQPRWVIEHLTPENFSGPGHRSDFKTDEQIFSPSRSTDADYKGSGWSRGHNARAGDFKCSQALEDDTFLLSNICPQNIQNNNNIWGDLEQYVEDQIVSAGNDAFVVTGPLYLWDSDNTGKKSIHYEVIGNGISVPTHMFKVYVQRNASKGITKVECYLIPNIEIKDRSFKDFTISLADVEEKTRLQFPAIYHIQSGI